MVWRGIKGISTRHRVGSPNLHIGNLPLGIGAGSGTLGSALDTRVQLEPNLQRSNGPLGLQVGLVASRGVSAWH